MINRIKKYLNNKIGELYLEEVESVFNDIKEYNLEYGGRWYYVEDINYKFIKEEWNGEEDIMLCRYGDRGGINIGFEYRSDYEEEEWIDLRESDCDSWYISLPSEMSVLYIYEVEESKLYRRYFDEEEGEMREKLVEI